MNRFSKLSIKKQFHFLSLMILLIGMLVVGLVISSLIETGVINQTATITALYIDSFVSPFLQDAQIETFQNGNIHPSNNDYLVGLSRLLIDTPLGHNIASFKLWLSDGEIIYSTNTALIGSHFPITERLSKAFNGEIVSERSSLDDFEHIYENQHWDELIETYAPIKSEITGEIIAVAEFYLFPDELNTEISNAQLKSWAIVGLSTFVMYVTLAGIAGRASNTINLQQEELVANVRQLQDILAQNKILNNRIQRAASRATLLNEQFLRRISADLHDGPIQELALALLRIDPLSEAALSQIPDDPKNEQIKNDFRTIQNSLESSMKEIRNLSSELQLPGIENKSLADVCKRAVRDYEKKTKRTVEIDIKALSRSNPIPVIITVYRVIQEALMNGFHHTEDAKQKVTIIEENKILLINITDSGPGFNSSEISGGQKLGLSGMRERVEVLGGEFVLESSKNKGTSIKVRIPLSEISNIVEE
jgi:signal transduction histidine kinase